LTWDVEARESIYILDWWLSPELYLRRPPARNAQYRLDAMLKAAAERGVMVYVIVYKEVTQALTCKCIASCPLLSGYTP
jgi:phospholipase D1/2